MERYVLILVFIATSALVQAEYDKDRAKRADDNGGQLKGYVDDMTKKDLDGLEARVKRDYMDQVKQAAAAAEALLNKAAGQNVQSWSVTILVSLLVVYLANTVYM